MSAEAATASEGTEGSEDAKSILFLSCDIVGSTHFKQQSTKMWQRTFLSFYREFPQALATECQKDGGFKGEIRLWKAVGDELIFRATVRDETDILLAIRSWLGAMSSYERDTLSDEGLSTKGGAFIATFPGPDSQSSIPIDPTLEQSDLDVVELNRQALGDLDINKYLFDYFGPSIDTGFRIFGMSSQRYFTMSVEVTWAITELFVSQRAGKETHSLDDLVFRGVFPLKGVWNGREYPLFALDREAQDGVNVALKRLADSKVDLRNVATLCRECCGSPRWPSKLYLPNSERSEFKVVPEDPMSKDLGTAIDGFETIPEEPEPIGEISTLQVPTTEELLKVILESVARAGRMNIEVKARRKSKASGGE